ncbi:hypothetical protein PG993_008856 [Apiospora rasikravindrae]|uniref:2EXR domain-containing protein n=1 Tax=Apiospora rasikravindrae TaxID=990691 RepID=A0ABR1SPI7_9PEZI
MSTFPQFSRFVPELREMIWKEALKNEAKDRIALVHRDSRRIVPSKSLVSPLLAVNHDLREVALAYFDVRLDVVHLNLDPAIEDTYSWAATRPEDWEHHVRTETYIAAHKALTSQPASAQPATPKGCLYLNSQDDTFLLSFKATVDNRPRYLPPIHQDNLEDACVKVVAYAKIAEVLGPSVLKAYEEPHPCVSVPLPATVCSLTPNVVYATPHYDLDLKPWPGKLYYPSTTVEMLWMAHLFHQMRGSPVGAANGAPYRTLEDLRHAAIS